MIRLIQRLAYRVRDSRVFAWTYLGQIVLLNTMMLVFVPAAFADDCSIDPRRAEDCLRTPGFAENLGTGVAVIGTILVNGVAIQTIILKRRDPDDKDNTDPPVTYCLKIKTEGSRTTLRADGKDTLWLFAKVSCSDPKVDCSAMTAAIGFCAGGANPDWLQYPRNEYQGDYRALQLAAVNPNPAAPVSSPSASIDITAQLPDGTLSSTLPLQLEVAVDFVASVDGTPCGSFDKSDKIWRFPNVLAYFCPKGEDTPVKPPFKYYDLKLTTDPPDLLSVKEAYSITDGLTWQFEVLGAATEKYVEVFGPNLDQGDGKFDVIITTVDETQQTWTATTKMSVAPEAVMMVYSFNDTPANATGQHSYRGVDFGEFEFVADAEDRLQLAIVFVRSDQIDAALEPSDYFPDRILDCVRIDEISLTGAAADEFTVEGDVPTGGNSIGSFGLCQVKISAKEPLLAVPENKHLALNLYVRAEVDGPTAHHFANTDIHGNQAVKPMPVTIRTVVVPSSLRMKSEAYTWVGVETPDGAMPLPQTQLMFDVVSTGSSGQLAIAGPDQKTTDKEGIAMCQLDYSGLDWKNVGDARFKVRSGIMFGGEEPETATYVEINVGENLKGYLDEVIQNVDSIDLNNPYWKNNKKSILGLAGDMMWPDSLTGPLNNAIIFAAMAGRKIGHAVLEAAPRSGNPGVTPEEPLSPEQEKQRAALAAIATKPIDQFFDTSTLDHYVCQEMCNRILKFSIGRRFSADLSIATSMNGLEFDTYVVAPIHVFAGFTLSGTEDPYFIDPWWDQWFNQGRVIMTYTDEVTKLGACVALMLSGAAAAALVFAGAAPTLAAAGAILLEWLEVGLWGLQGTRVINALSYTFGSGLVFHIGKNAPMDKYTEAKLGWGRQFLQTDDSAPISPLEDW